MGDTSALAPEERMSHTGRTLIFFPGSRIASASLALASVAPSWMSMPTMSLARLMSVFLTIAARGLQHSDLPPTLSGLRHTLKMPCSSQPSITAPS